MSLTLSLFSAQVSEISIVVSNPLPFDVKVSGMSAHTTGAAFEPYVCNAFILPALCPGIPVRLLGKAIEEGPIELRGCYVQTFGVQSLHWLPWYSARLVLTCNANSMTVSNVLKSLEEYH